MNKGVYAEQIPRFSWFEKDGKLHQMLGKIPFSFGRFSVAVYGGSGKVDIQEGSVECDDIVFPVEAVFSWQRVSQ